MSRTVCVALCLFTVIFPRTLRCQAVAASRHATQRELLPYSTGDGKWGYINERGEVVVPAEFASATFFYGGFGIVQYKNGRCAYVNSLGKVVFPEAIKFCGTFSEGLATVQVSNRFGVAPEFMEINENGNLVFPARFASLGDFVDGLAPARGSGATKCGYIKKDGAWAIKPSFDDCRRFAGGLAVVESGTAFRKCGYIDRKGSVVVPVKFERCSDFSDGVASVAVYLTLKDQFLADTSVGRFLLRRLHPVNDVYWESPTVSTWYPRLSWGYITPSGNWTISPRYQIARPFSEGIAAVGENGQMLYVDSKGNTIFKTIFSQAEQFQDGFAKVGISNPRGAGERFGVIDRSGTFVHRPRFASVFDFELIHNGMIRIVEELGGNGWAYTGHKARTTFVSASGDIIWPKPNVIEKLNNRRGSSLRH